MYTMHLNVAARDGVFGINLWLEKCVQENFNFEWRPEGSKVE